MTVSFDSTITEHDMDAASRLTAQNMANFGPESEPDLDVDGLSDSITARFKRFLAFGRE